jgi:putative oxidoreductase
MAPLSSLGKHADLGLLILRVGVGTMFVVHGLPKLLGGADKWAKLGETMSNLGVDFAPTFWGLMAALSETVGGVLLAVGFLTRPVCMVMAFTMLVATVHHLSRGDGISGASHAIEALSLFLGLVLVGPGRHSIDKA